LLDVIWRRAWLIFVGSAVIIGIRNHDAGSDGSILNRLAIRRIILATTESAPNHPAVQSLLHRAVTKRLITDNVTACILQMAEATTSAGPAVPLFTSTASGRLVIALKTQHWSP
jgi:hypothetical protein